MLKRGRFKIKRVVLNDLKVIYLILQKRGFFSRWETLFIGFSEKELFKYASLSMLPETYGDTLDER